MESKTPSQVVRSWWFRGLAVLTAVGIAVGIWSLATPSLPSQHEAEQDVASGVGREEHTTVTAHCTVPDDSGYTCRLRDAAGRYGYSSTFFHDERRANNSRITTRYGMTTWSFPLNADGTGTTTLDAAPPRDLKSAIFGVLMMVSGATGQPDAYSLYGAIDCGDYVTREATACTVRAPVLSATVRVVDGYEYELTYRVALPRS
ncbi:hypothetical protein [Actinophytocola sp.]|uniref:hypothetical protein n=1 Tax=Actinophytocola sp. TaxID=1872138 RepID=UPI0038998511